VDFAGLRAELSVRWRQLVLDPDPDGRRLRDHVLSGVAPAAKKVKAASEMVKSLRRGDTVVTSGGRVGKVTKVVDDDQIEVELAEGVRVRQMRAMVSDVRAKSEPAKDESTSS
jgi:preprotein translocase subunit YajC